MGDNNGQDIEDLIRLCEGYRERICGYLSWKMRGDIEKASMFCEETLTEARKNIYAGNYKPKEGLLNYLKRLADNTCCSHLAISVGNGDMEAFWDIYDIMFPRIKKYISRKIGAFTIKGEDAEDICRNIFLNNVLKALQSTYDPSRNNMGAYLLSIARRDVLDRLKKAKKEIPFPSNEKGEDGAQQYPDKHPPYDYNQPDIHQLKIIFEILALRHPKPHLCLTFLYRQFLGKPPRAIAGELSDIPFLKLTQDFCKRRWEYINIKECLRFLFEDYKKAVKAIYVEPQYKGICKLFIGKLTGELFMRVCYTSEPTDCISNWCNKIKKILKDTLHARGKGFSAQD